MTKKEKMRLIRILVFTGLFLGGILSFSHFWPKIRKEKSPEVIEIFEEKIKESGLGKTVFKILGAETEKETEEKEKEEERKDAQSTVENFKEKIEKVIIEKSSQKVIDILKTLPPEEFEELKKEFCPQFCSP